MKVGIQKAPFGAMGIIVGVAACSYQVAVIDANLTLLGIIIR